MRWIWGDIFTMEVPSNWEVHDRGEVIEIVPPNPVGAAHISVLKRTENGLVQPGEASRLASEFARKQGVKASAEGETSHGAEGVSRIPFTTTDSGTLLFWVVVVRVWPARALICSFCHGGNQAAERLALEMFSSIEPVEA